MSAHPNSQVSDAPTGAPQGAPTGSGLKAGLKNRHLSMIAIGGVALEAAAITAIVHAVSE